MRQVDSFKRRYAAMLSYKTRESLILPRRKAPSDSKHWSPDMKAIRATIKYAVATGRLELKEEERLDHSQ
jgi:hypothetical protein